MDNWEDDLILQAFNRNLILSPQIYGNPWLLRDDEYSYLAYIFNLHRDYNAMLVNGIQLSEAQYGAKAVSRGDAATRWITLRNISWEPRKYTITLNDEIGLTKKGTAKVRLYHPYIYDMGTHAYGSTVEVEVLPFRSALVKVTTQKEADRIALSGIPYQIVNDRVGPVAQVKLLGKPGESYKVRLESGAQKLKTAIVGSESTAVLLAGKTVNITFPGEKTTADYHRRLATLSECPTPDDAEAIYYATCFAADNNALEVRSLKRSGATAIPQVQKARDAFFNQRLFRGKEAWDKYVFDDDPATVYSVDLKQVGKSNLYLDLGENIKLDKLIFEIPDIFSMNPWLLGTGVTAYISPDLKNWKKIVFWPETNAALDLSKEDAIRYVRIAACPMRVSEIIGYRNGVQVDRSKWKANNLFGKFRKVEKAWKTDVTLDGIDKGAYLCVALDGKHGDEGAWVGFKVDGRYVGAPDRAPSFPSNVWEYMVKKTDKNYTYYLPLTPEMKGKKIEVYVLGFNQDIAITPNLWLTAYPIPFESKLLELK
jgi:hypothetical protein